MYVVREKKSKKIVHVNPAPLEQALGEKEIYFRFDARTMEIGRSDGPLPDHFDINKDGEIVELGLEEKVKAGIIELEPNQKVENGEVVEKTLAEKAADGLIELGSDQKVEEDRIVAKTQQEMLEEGKVTLDEIRQQQKAIFSSLAIQKRQAILPDFKIQNALMGIYEDGRLAAYKSVIEAFRKEYQRLEGLVDAAESLDDLDKIKARFPESLPGKSGKDKAASSPQTKKGGRIRSEKKKSTS